MQRAKPHSQQGFSLIETVAAMGILAMAALPLMQVASDATRNTSRLESRLLARTVAENVMARLIADPVSIEAGLQTGNEDQMGRRFVWTLTAGPGIAGDVQTLQVTVTEAEDPQVLARLQSLRAVPRIYVLPRDPSESGDDNEAEGDE